MKRKPTADELIIMLTTIGFLVVAGTATGYDLGFTTIAGLTGSIFGIGIAKVYQKFAVKKPKKEKTKQIGDLEPSSNIKPPDLWFVIAPGVGLFVLFLFPAFFEDTIHKGRMVTLSVIAILTLLGTFALHYTNKKLFGNNYKSKPKLTAEGRKKYAKKRYLIGVDGWLLLLTLNRLFQPLTVATLIFVDRYFFGDLFTSVPLTKHILYYAPEIIITSLGFVAAIMILSYHKKAIQVMRLTLWIALVYHLILLLVPSFREFLGVERVYIASSILWLFYFYGSKRVQKTFTKRPKKVPIPKLKALLFTVIVLLIVFVAGWRSYTVSSKILDEELASAGINNLQDIPANAQPIAHHYSSIGYDVSSMDDLIQVALLPFDENPSFEIGEVEYHFLNLNEGIQLISLSDKEELHSYYPSFISTSENEVELIHDPDPIYDYEFGQRAIFIPSGKEVYFDWIPRKEISDLREGETHEVAITALPFWLEYYPSESALYSAKHNFDSEVYFVSGFFGDESNSTDSPWLVFTGKITDTRVIMNEVTNNEVRWIKVEEDFGPIEIVWPEQKFNVTPKVGGYVYGEFWLQARLLDS